MTVLLFIRSRNICFLTAIVLLINSINVQATDLTSELIPEKHISLIQKNDSSLNEVESDSEQSKKIEKSVQWLKYGRDYLVVPLPIQSPTFGAGLVVGGAYFYKQTEQQKSVQPASLTGAVAAYTSTNSYAVGLLQQNYWDADNWRFKGIVSYLDFNLDLVDPASVTENEIGWLLKGELIQADLYRKLVGKWYVGLSGRYIDFTQSLTVNDGNDNDGFAIDEQSQTVGLGIILERDSRDLPTNAYTGSLLNITMVDSQLRGVNSTSDYQSYAIRYRFYHRFSDPLVLAYDLNACDRSGNFPLWDTCRLSLRGFSATRYLSESSASAQVEARWKFYKKWGVVGFVGAGYVGSTFGDTFNNDTVPSYGVGLRWMISGIKRINLRLDYARSTDTDAWYFSAAEYF